MGWIRGPKKTYPGSSARGQKSIGSRIRISNIGSTEILVLDVFLQQ